MLNNLRVHTAITPRVIVKERKKGGGKKPHGRNNMYQVGQNWYKSTVKKILLAGCLSTMLLKTYSSIDTLKAPNLGPYVNVGLIFQKGWLSSKPVLRDNEERESCTKILHSQIWACSFSVHNSSKEAMELARKGSKFP
jgi:hypothetical protein